MSIIRVVGSYFKLIHYLRPRYKFHEILLESFSEMFTIKNYENLNLCLIISH